MTATQRPPSNSFADPQSGARPLCFGPFRLDIAQAQLCRNGQPIPLSPKALAVLAQLVEARGALVTKDMLFDTVWSGSVVGDAALTVCIREIRKALDDSSRKPRYVATVHKRGYRFVADIEAPAADLGEDVAADEQAVTLIGREVESTRLQSALRRAGRGERQTVFVTGEAGAGKTTLVEAWLRQLGRSPEVWIARGQCVEHHGHVEPYLPWLDAITSLCRHDPGALALFHRFAPTWLLQIPSLLSGDARDELERQLAGANPHRMAREMLEALQALAQSRPLVIYLDDLHFSDKASVELLTSLARRPGAARILLVACYRPVDLVVQQHPLKTVKQELEVRGLCGEIALESFSVEHVATYIDTRLPNNELPHNLASAIHARTNGNPLFTLNVVEYLLRQQWLQQTKGRWRLTCTSHTVTTCVPDSLVQMLGYHIEQLRPDVQSMLEVAAVASDAGTGDVQFSAAEVAVALAKDQAWVEDQCDALAQHGHFLREAEGAGWPDGTLLTRYAFTHGLYQKAFYRRLTAAKRALIHQRIGLRLVQAFGDRDREIASELAVHFEQGRDYARAANYLLLAAEIASRRAALNESRNNLERVAQLAKLLPEDRQRATLEMKMHTAMGTLLIAEQGNAAPEVERNYAQAQQLCRQVGDERQMFPIVFGLRSCTLLAGRLEEAHRLGQDLLDLAARVGDADLITEARVAMASTAFFLGRFQESLEHACAGIETYAPERHGFHVIHYGLDPGVFCRCRAAQALWSLGLPHQALQRVREATQLADQLAHPYSLVFALNNHAWVHMFRREAPDTEEKAARAVRLAHRHGFSFHELWGQVMQHWAAAVQGDHDVKPPLLSSMFSRPMPMAAAVRSYLLTILADTYLHHRDFAQGLAALDAVTDGAEQFLEAERHRLRGKLLLEMAAAGAQHETPSAMREAEDCFHRALHCARRQQARSLELRAALGQAEYWLRCGRGQHVRQLLEPLLAQFDSESDTLDMREAQALLDDIAVSGST